MICAWLALHFHLTCGTYMCCNWVYVHCACWRRRTLQVITLLSSCWQFQLCRWNNGPLSYLFSSSQQQQQQQPTFGFSSHPSHLQLMVIEGELDAATQEIFLCLASSDGLVTLPSMETILLQPGVRIVLVRASLCTWSTLTRETGADKICVSRGTTWIIVQYGYNTHAAHLGIWFS